MFMKAKAGGVASLVVPDQAGLALSQRGWQLAGWLPDD
jgi:hypothetical protein